MTKIHPKARAPRQASLLEPMIRGRIGPRQAGTATTQSVTPVDRITLSASGLAAAARFSNCIRRPADACAIALPAPCASSEVSDAGAVAESPAETPAARRRIRESYEKQPGDSDWPAERRGSQIDILV